jgi:SnoaL-like domain
MAPPGSWLARDDMDPTQVKPSLRVLITALAVGALAACGPESKPVNNSSNLVDFATRYAGAWCSHSAAGVASFYSESGSLAINGGPPAVGRNAVQAAAQNFMTAYPDLVVKFDRLEPRGDRVLFHWTFVGTNSGPGGTGKLVRISGYEDWKIGPDGRIADSKGHYDAQDWDRQAKQ